MLVLSRKKGEALLFSHKDVPRIRVVVLETNRGTVKLGIEADKSVKVLREELK